MDTSIFESDILRNALPEAVFLEDLDGDIIDVNDQACQLLGYEKEELLELTVDDLVPEGAPAFLPGQIDEATKSGEPLETINLDKEGEEIPVELRGNIVEIEGAERILVSVRDISKRKEAEKELNRSKQRYQSYFEKLGDAVYITKVGGEDHGRILDANSAAVEQTGYSREELIEMNIEGNITVEGPENITYEEGNRKLSRGETLNFREKKRRKDGTEYWTDVVVTRIEHEGAPATLSINRDITERKKAKEQLERYRMAVEGSDDLMAACDKAYNYIFANEAYRDFYEVGEAEIRDYKVGDLIGDDPFQSKVKPRIERCLKGERIEYEMERTHPEKGPRQLRITYYPLKGEGQIHGIVAVMRDVTERKRTERALNEERDKLRHLHDAVDELQKQGTEAELIQTAVDVAEDMLDFRFCDMSLVEGDYLVPKASGSGVDPEESVPFEVGEGITGKTIQKGETIWGEDFHDYPEAKPTNEDFRAFISVPIGELGVFQVISEKVGGFDKEDVKLAEILSNHLREELKRVRLEEDLRQQAIRDPLTELYNRRYFNETLEEEVERCKRYDKSLAFLMTDVDRFKEINDRYSHQTGDEVLREVAGLLQAHVRDADTAVRYGGDEFLVMMTQTEAGVTNTVERLKTALDNWNQESDLLDFPLTLAMGISYWSPKQNGDVEEALKKADRKMYEDKDR
jgi:diguanylate cyclase (GGDEF)-like protein/PAS domain S-box-containing protein